MNFYLNYFKREENAPDDFAPVGIVLGAYKDEFLVEYATEGIDNIILAGKYQMYLSDKETLSRELRRLMYPNT